MHDYRDDGGNAAQATGRSPSRLGRDDEALFESKRELLVAFQDLITEGKAFLKSTAGLSGEAVDDARARFAARLGDAKQRWGGWSRAARIRSRQAAMATDDYVHAKPWLAVGMAAGIAFVIAAVAAKR